MGVRKGRAAVQNTFEVWDGVCDEKGVCFSFAIVSYRLKLYISAFFFSFYRAAGSYGKAWKWGNQRSLRRI